MSLPYDVEEPPENWEGWDRLSYLGGNYDNLTQQEKLEHAELVEYIDKFQEMTVTQAIVNRVCSSLDFVAICVVDHVELIQLKDGSYLYSEWNSCTEKIEKVKKKCQSDLNLDLQIELQSLRNENYQLRGGLLHVRKNRNLNLAGQGLGKYAMIYVAVGTDIEWLMCERPMIDGKYKNNAVNRLFQAVGGDYFTLV